MLFISACAPEEDLVNCDFDQQSMLTNYADNVIVPRFEDLSTGMTLFKGAVEAFNANPTIGLLNELRITFASNYLAYQHCGTFAFGPGLIDGSAFRERFNTFPTNVTSIQNSIDNGSAASATPNSAVGFPAVEYLIFGQEGTSDQQIVDQFSTAPDAANRKAFLLQLVEEMQQTTDDIVAGWGTYRSQFVSSTGVAQGSSVSLLVNELNFDSEVLKNFKFKIPLGKFNGGIVIPENVEGLYAGNSLELAEEHSVALKNVFTGTGTNGADGQGLDDYLECLNAGGEEEPLRDAMLEQFDAIRAGIQSVPGPLSEALVSNKAIVDDAYDQMQLMVPLMKHEMTSILGVQINYQDNDGD